MPALPPPTALPGGDYPIPSGAIFVAPSGSDSAPGTPNQPLRTIAAAVARARGGNTIVLRGGDYRESINSVYRRVTIQPYPGEVVWFNGADVVTGWRQQGRGWRSTTYRSRLCRTCFQPAAIDQANPLAGSPNQVFINGSPLVEVAGETQLTTGTFYVAGDGTVVIGSDPGGQRVEVSARWKAIQFNPGADGSVLRGLGFRHYAPTWNESQLAAVIANAPRVTIENNVLRDIAGTALAVTKPGGWVGGNVVVRNGYRGMVANYADGLVVTGNRFDKNNSAGFGTTGCGSYCTVAGVKITRSRGVEVTGNSFANNTGAGLWCDLGCIDARISGNTVTGNSTNGIYYEVSTLATITDNVISGNGRGLKISGSDRVTVTGNQFRDNVIDLGVYDDPRSPSSDPHSARNGLTWNTRAVAIQGNSFTGSGRTSFLLETNRTPQVSAPGMISAFTGNTFQPSQGGRVYWCTAKCTTFATTAAFLASGQLAG